MTALSPDELHEIEMLAVELAERAGADIVSRLGSLLSVRYKTGAEDDRTLRNPVSDVDEAVERAIRERLAGRFPEHDVIGEEFDHRPGRDHSVVWAIDPIDGTSNFVNGFPLFACSIGVLERGRPVAAAVWCATSHALRPGVYHARKGSGLRFDRQPLTPARNPMVHRRLAGVPQFRRGRHPWDLRKTGSAAIECAFVAAGLLEAAAFNAPNLWDVAGGVLLVIEAGGTVLEGRPGAWRDFADFAPRRARDDTPDTPDAPADLARWNAGLILGTSAEAARIMAEEAIDAR